MFFESNTNVVDQVLIIESPTFDRTSTRGRCFTFWYYLKNFNGSFTFELLDTKLLSLTVVWQLIVDEPISSGQWEFASFGFYSENEYSVVNSLIFANELGSVALDDFSFKESHLCSVYPAAAQTSYQPNIPTPTKPMLTTKAPSSLDCDFENSALNGGFCAWQVVKTLPIEWTRNKGHSLSFGTGPQVDHT